MSFGPLPQSIAEVARRTADTMTASTFEYELSDFLHEFARRRDLAMFEEIPPLLAGLFSLGNVYDAYLAATTTAICMELAQVPPAWTRYPERFLELPWFANPGRHMRALLLVESPSAFRERNLFVSANALSVA